MQLQPILYVRISVTWLQSLLAEHRIQNKQMIILSGNVISPENLAKTPMLFLVL